MVAQQPLRLVRAEAAELRAPSGTTPTLYSVERAVGIRDRCVGSGPDGTGGHGIEGMVFVGRHTVPTLAMRADVRNFQLVA